MVGSDSLGEFTFTSARKRLGLQVMANRELQFWSCQFAGWLGISLISYVSLNLWYNQPQITYVLHNVLQSFIGIALSWPLRSIFRAFWGATWLARLVVGIVSVLVLALAWAAIRLAIFELMTQETNLWSDFGGWYFSSIFIFFCWAAFYHVIKYYQLLQEERNQLLLAEATQKEEMVRRISAEAAMKESQLTLLRYQLNPHFLFNTLNSIYALVNQGSSELANMMLLNLSQFLRYSLDHGTSRSVSLADEIDALKLYLAIEKTRFDDRIEVEFDTAVETANAFVPSFLLQPLIENAIKHAIAQSEQGGKIRIMGRKEGERLFLVVEDSGPRGLDAKSIPNKPAGAGVGLKNVRERVAALYGDEGELEISRSELGGFRVDIQFPFVTRERALAND